MSNVRTQIGKVIGKSLNGYHSRVKPKIDELKFKEQYQGRIIDCMVGEVDDNYIETPLTDENVVKLEHSKEGVIKIPQIKGKTILVDADGNETDTPAEGCRLVSVGEEEDNKLIILSKNKNLFDGKLVQGAINLETDGSDINGNTSTYRSDYVFVKESTEYTLNFSRSICFYDKNKIRINNIYGATFTTPKNCCYIRFQQTGNEEVVTLTEGNQIVNIPHKSHKTEISLKEPLRSLPNGICDEIVDNKLIRRVGKVTLTGEEGWWSNWTNVSFFEWFSNLRITNWKPISDNIAWYSNKLKSTTSYSIEQQGQFNCFCFGVDWNATNPKVIVRPSYDIVEEGNVDQFKEWLKKNNMIILYELAEPIIEELPNSITLQGFDDTTIYIENTITPTVTYGYNALIPFKEEVLNQQQEVETNTLDIEQNIIPYLMDMEFNLMLMEDE